MKLMNYLESKKISQTQFSIAVGKSPSVVHGWITGRRLPRAEALALIERETKGAVTAVDFCAEVKR